MRKEALILIFVVFLNFVSADFQVSNYSIKENYTQGAILEGWLNMSFSNQPLASLLHSNFLGEIKLSDFLKNNSIGYKCKPLDCKEDYMVDNPEEAKSFSLKKDEEKTFVFVVEGKLNEITDLEFDVLGSNKPSCVAPLEIDILDDETIEYKSRTATNEFSCPYKKETGCFDIEEEFQEVYIGKTPYCEKIGLSASSKFELGAWIRKASGYPEDKLKMALYNLNGEELKSCDLGEPSALGGRISCQINYTNKENKEYYVCIMAESKDTTKYITKKEDAEACGFYAYPGQEKEYYDYYIFAKGALYENMSNITLNQKEYEQEGNPGSLMEYINEYLAKRYEKNCLDNCKIPIRFKAHTDINIKISNLKLSYSTLGGIQTPEKLIYDSWKKSAELSSDFSKMDLGLSNMHVPTTSGEYAFNLKIGNANILNKNIRVENSVVIKKITPTSIPAVIPAKFTLDISIPDDRKVVSYKWDFGDNTTEETSNNSVVHSYYKIKDYVLSVEVKDSRNFRISKKFTISVGSAKEIANSTIREYKNRLSNITTEISKLDEYKDIVKEKLEIEAIKNKVDSLGKRYNSATESDYSNIMKELLQLEIPYMLKISKGEMPFFVSEEKINLNYLKELGAGEIGEKKSVAEWANNNLEMSLSFNYIDAYYENEIENVFNFFRLKILAKEEKKELYVLIGEKVKVENEKVKEFRDAVGLVFPDIKTREIKFFSEEEIPPDIVIYASPKSAYLAEKTLVCNFNEECEKEIGENWENCRQDCKPWGIVAILLIIVLAFAFVAYIFLQWWYKVRYESYLFKNRNDIYNIMQFVTNARNQGLQDKEIKAKLKSSGWSGEQLSYVFKKIEGKAIMPFDFFKLFKRQDKTF